MMESAAKELLNRIRVCDFILTETNLYLDSHPDDEAALAFYRERLATRKAAATEYAEKYGMLSPMDYTGGRWSWVNSPWPWEYKED